MFAYVISHSIPCGKLFSSAFNRVNVRTKVVHPSKFLSLEPVADLIMITENMEEEDWNKLLPFLTRLKTSTPIIFCSPLPTWIFNEKDFQVIQKQLIPMSPQLSIQQMVSLSVEFLLSSNQSAEERFKLNTEERKIQSKQAELQLTKREFFMLKVLLKNKTHITTREKLIEFVWGRKQYIAPNTIDVYISRLRKKLGSFPSMPKIRTIPTLGYTVD